MPNFVLNLEEEYTLFGIRSNLSDFTLVYFLNKHLNMGLNREKNDLSIIHLQMKIFFSLFNYYDYETNNQWSVIKNKTRFKNIVIEKNNLFANNQMSMLMHFIPEYKNFDFIIKITGLLFNKKEIISLINKIKNIEIISEISDLENLSNQSKGNLCF
tara:strand:- start:305 stop:775 length:471 start_codon:yes stop_codon:yes gene_type:complete